MYKPLLAAKPPKEKDGSLVKVEKLVYQLQYPLFASYKTDGIRVTIHEELAKTRKLKLVPNDHIRGLLSNEDHAGTDGEVVSGPPTDPNAFRTSTSAVMSKEGEPHFIHYLFDDHSRPDLPFEERYKILRKKARDLDNVLVVPQELIETPEDLLEFEAEQLDLGYEGTIVRSVDGHYKYNRSTWKEGILLKLVRLERTEAVVIGYEERMHNGNEATINELGKTKRSSHKENKTGRGDLGALILESKEFPTPFKVGTGYDDKLRAYLWSIKEQLPGKIVTFEHRPYGNYDSPRFATFVGFRDKMDM